MRRFPVIMFLWANSSKSSDYCIFLCGIFQVYLTITKCVITTFLQSMKGEN